MLRTQRGLVLKVVALGAVITFLLTLYTTHPSSAGLRASVSDIFSVRQRSQCTPEQWASGQWTRRDPPRTHKQNASSVADVLEFEGFQGCASDREYKWHLAADDDQFDRFPEVAAYKWTPPSTCNVRELDREAFVADLVEKGGWLLIGDSVTENHFFSLSCLLYPHVIATPNYTLNPYWDRAWPQNLYLNPKSPLVEKLQLPEGFNISVTPLVTFRRVDLLLSSDQLVELYRTTQPYHASQENFDLLGGDQVWEIPPSEYLSIFTAPLPQANYGTMIVSTAGHWTPGTFHGLRDPDLPFDGIENVLAFFSDAMAVWARLAQQWLTSAERAPDAAEGGGAVTKGGRRRQVVVRAYLPGHDGCHYIFHPWKTYEQADSVLPYNWGQIKLFNQLFQAVLGSKTFRDVHFLPIDRPALLRPDAHAGGDCLHLMSGSGVIEGWTEYIWHYVTREVGAWVR
ncbi:hypothetical protein PsYK624_061780 [Phanerochaete sordida]|uniref:Uncharacterized protein n=1 Tax=Phanerochaete sordida TaxID=48140 RepID=A0A9P3LCA9_9APHY|nr:hypothetical protein PsYK624_061780 [Phanerochaete sordida]